MAGNDMVQTPSTAPKQGASGSAPETDAGTDCYAQIVSLARSAPSTQAYFSGVLQAIADSVGSPYGAIYLRLPSEVIQDDWHSDGADARFWKAGVQAFLTESLTECGTRARVLKTKRGGEKIAFVAAPLFKPGGVQIGAISLVLAPFEEDNVTTRLSWLESLTRLASFAAEFVNAAPGEAGGPSAAAPNQALARAAAYATPEELAFAITNNLRNKLGCEQVALGMATGRRVKILSISGLDQVAKQGDGVVCLQAAMEECYDARQVLACQPEGAWSSDGIGNGYRLHMQWSAAAKGGAVVSIPLEANNKVAAVVSLRRRAGEPWTSEQIAEIRSRLEPFAGALVLARRAARGVLRHALDATRDAVSSLLSPGNYRRKILTAAAAVAATWFVFGSTQYHLTVPCSVAPARIRHVTVPFDGVLLAANALEGDRVSAGDLLCEMDHRDLDQQRAELLAEIAVLEHERDRAMAQDSPVDVQLALATQQLARAKLDIVDTRIGQASVRSPIDGVVVSGDLRKRIGGVATRGEPLYEVAPLDEWRLELYIPEAEADELGRALAGSFIPHARPEESHPFRVARVRPQAEIHDQANVYVGEADIDLPYSWMRPGMEGVAKIDAGRRRVWWVALHRAIEYVQYNLWP